MAAAREDIKLEQGATWQQVFDLYENGAPVDLSGYTARMTIRDRDHSGASVAELTTENGRISLSSGRVSLTLPASATAALDFDKGVYDLELVSGSTVTRLLEGRVVLSREATR